MIKPDLKGVRILTGMKESKSPKECLALSIFAAEWPAPSELFGLPPINGSKEFECLFIDSQVQLTHPFTLPKLDIN